MPRYLQRQLARLVVQSNSILVHVLYAYLTKDCALIVVDQLLFFLSHQPNLGLATHKTLL